LTSPTVPVDRPVRSVLDRLGPTAESGLLGLLLGLLVVAPWTRGGYLLLTDWVSGPRQDLNPGVYGLSGGSLDTWPFRVGTQVLRDLVGPGTTAWLLVLAFFPVASAGVSALVGGSRWRRHPAALLAVCNPFVVDRLRVGHVPFLLGVALLPWLMASARQARQEGRRFGARTAGWYGLAMSVSPHAAWLGGAMLLAVALLPRPTRRDLARTVAVILAAGLVYCYAAVVFLTGIHPLRVTDADLTAFATRPGPGGPLVAVAALRGFWRGSGDLVVGRLGPTASVLALLAMLLLVGGGLARLVRVKPDLGLQAGALTVVGLLLAAGIDGPAGGAYRLAFHWLPLFQAMREQQKWDCLAMLGYAVGFGGVVEWVAGVSVRPFGRVVAGVRPLGRVLPAALPAALAAALAGVPLLLVAPSLLLGLGGTVSTSTYPASWYAADRMLGAGDGAVLFLPWHAYQPFAFTGGRAVATPASVFFRRPVLSSDAMELGALRTDSTSLRTAYVDRLMAVTGDGHLGRLLAPLGVRYVVLARDREAARYSWLARQPDLELLLATGDLDLYRVRPAGVGRVVSARAASYQQARTLAAAGKLGSEALLPGGPASGPVPTSASGGLRRTSAVGWRLDPGRPGWVVLPEEWSAGWRLAGRPGQPTVAGTVAFRAGPGGGTVEYRPWRWLRVAAVGSLLTLVGLLAAGLVEHRGGVRRAVSRWRPAVSRPRRPREQLRTPHS
jgi:hypothetical protein